ncbi:MAG: hypothetical protein AAGA11_22980, partial [Pseudomonadota bacterium]
MALNTVVRAFQFVSLLLFLASGSVLAAYIQDDQGLVVMEAENGAVTAGSQFTWAPVGTPSGASGGSSIKSTGHSWDKSV